MKRFFASFLIFLLCISLLFAFGDLLVRLSTLPSFFSLPKIFLLMLPLMTLFSFPLASSLAVQTTVASLYWEDEILFFQFFKKARLKLHGFVLLFSFLLTLLYIPLVLNWAPSSYWNAKRYIINSIKEQFDNLKPNSFHAIIPNFTFFFKNKGIDDTGNTVFNNVVLNVKDSQGAQYFITAQTCYLSDCTLHIRSGALQSKNGKTWYSGTFEQTTIDLEMFLEEKKLTQRPVKFLTIRELLARKATDSYGFVEFHKRIAQIIWQFLFPLLALWGMLVLGTKHSTFLTSILVSGGLFLYSYIGLSLAQTFAKDAFVALLCLYGCSSLALFLFFIFYKRHWL